MKVLLTGANGFVGKSLSKSLLNSGHQLVAVTRNKENFLKTFPFPCEIITCDLEKNLISPLELKGVDAVVHLAGENIGKRWNREVKKRIRDSRVLTSQNLIKSFQQENTKEPTTFISASAVGIYGDRGAEILTEDSSPWGGFLADVCKEWESVLQKSSFKHAQPISLRFGIVLGKEGGFLEKMLPLFNCGLAGKIADGKQWMSWIHLDDLVSIIKYMLEKKLRGIYNATAPQPVTNELFTQTLASVLNRPAALPVPKVVLKMAMGEMSSLALSSQRVIPENLLELEFNFKYPELRLALKNILQ